jgi:hypothetical protein
MFYSTNDIIILTCHEYGMWQTFEKLRLFTFHCQLQDGELLRNRLSLFQLCQMSMACNDCTLVLSAEIHRKPLLTNDLCHLVCGRHLQGGDLL